MLLCQLQHNTLPTVAYTQVLTCLHGALQAVDLNDPLLRVSVGLRLALHLEAADDIVCYKRFKGGWHLLQGSCFAADHAYSCCLTLQLPNVASDPFQFRVWLEGPQMYLAFAVKL